MIFGLSDCVTSHEIVDTRNLMHWIYAQTHGIEATQNFGEPLILGAHKLWGPTKFWGCNVTRDIGNYASADLMGKSCGLSKKSWTFSKSCGIMYGIGKFQSQEEKVQHRHLMQNIP